MAAEKKVGDRQKTDAATRRSKRKNSTTGEIHMHTADLCRLVFESISTAKTTHEFGRELAARGIEVEWSANQSGLKLRPIASSTWLKGSSLNRELSAAKVVAALARNAELQADAERAAAVVVSTADGRATAVAAARMGRNEALAVSQVVEISAPRALPPAELDDAPLVAAGPPSSPEADPQEAEEMARARAAALDRDEADAELSQQLRAMNAKQLLELRNTSKRPLDELVITAALIERLLALAARILSFGLWKASTPMADALRSRERVAAAADDEITRRHRTPHTVADRMKFLKEHTAALNSRRIQIDAHQTAAALSKLYPAPEHPAEHPGVTKLKAELLQHESRLEKISNDEPGVMAKMRKSAAFLRWQKDAARAKELRAITSAALDELVDEIQESVRARAAENAAAVEAANKVLKDESQAIEIEIRDRIPSLQKQVERDELQARLRQVDDGSADVHRG